MVLALYRKQTIRFPVFVMNWLPLDLFERFASALTPEVIIPTAAGLVGVAVGCLVQWFISERQRITAFRIAALDLRLKTHQEAYRLWHEMFWALDDPDNGPKTAAQCQQWWIDHCLYLDTKSREAFLQYSRETGLYRDLKDLKDPVSLAERKALYEHIKNVFKLLEEGVHLPPIGELERPPVETRKES